MVSPDLDRRGKAGDGLNALDDRHKRHPPDAPHQGDVFCVLLPVALRYAGTAHSTPGLKLFEIMSGRYIDGLCRTFLLAEQTHNAIFRVLDEGFAAVVHCDHIAGANQTAVAAADAFFLINSLNSHIPYLTFRPE